MKGPFDFSDSEGDDELFDQPSTFTETKLWNPATEQPPIRQQAQGTGPQLSLNSSKAPSSDRPSSSGSSSDQKKIKIHWLKKKKSSSKVSYHDTFPSDSDDSDEEKTSSDVSTTIDRPIETRPIHQPFRVVLVNIRQAAEAHHIVCSAHPLDEVPYVALSYRWGELDEQLVRATDYHARITSFQLDDFFKLCAALLYEPDLKHIAYVWIDAICVNQQHLATRKSTIYRMNDIYIHAAAIVAVPDLHAAHLATITTANHATMTTLEKHDKYLYALLSKDYARAAELDKAWQSELGIPPTPGPRPPALVSLFHDPSRLKVACQQHEWHQHMDQRQAEIIQSMHFLQSVMEDWSNRTWVISEYHIAKRKTGKLKFWFNQLGLVGKPFFEFEFRFATEASLATLLQDPYTFHIVEHTRGFHESLRQRLTRRSVLEMMLHTKASKHEDRFHAIMPLTPYKHHIKDRDSISELGISDMLSVRLKLMEWMGPRDTLVLLYSKTQPLPSSVPSLPTFATHFKQITPGLAALLRKRKWDLNIDHRLRLIRGRFDELLMYPKTTLSWRQLRQIAPHPFWQEMGLEGNVAVVGIPLFQSQAEPTLWLMGSWEKNTWVRTLKAPPLDQCVRHTSNSYRFRIY